jgi:hypothetical protein
MSFINLLRKSLRKLRKFRSIEISIMSLFVCGLEGKALSSQGQKLVEVKTERTLY